MVYWQRENSLFSKRVRGIISAPCLLGRAYKIRIKCNLKKPSTVSDQIYSDSHPRRSHKYIIMD
jgi:hypothetical protein